MLFVLADAAAPSPAPDPLPVLGPHYSGVTDPTGSGSFGFRREELPALLPPSFDVWRTTSDRPVLRTLLGLVDLSHRLLGRSGRDQGRKKIPQKVTVTIKGRRDRKTQRPSLFPTLSSG